MGGSAGSKQVNGAGSTDRCMRDQTSNFFSAEGNAQERNGEGGRKNSSEWLGGGAQERNRECVRIGCG